MKAITAKILCGLLSVSVVAGSFMFPATVMAADEIHDLLLT